MKQQIPKDWKEVKLKEVLTYEQPTEYIVNSEILEEETETPVLTANKGFIKGYTKEKEGICKEVPVIIFDDFTTDSKFVNFPFKVKSSAMKILKLKDERALLKYIFYQMQTVNIRATTHKRYYLSEYQNLPFLFPINPNKEISLNKQSLIVQEIEKQFTRLDASIKELNSVKEKLKIYKRLFLNSTFNKVSEKRNLNELCEKITQGPNPKLKNYKGTEGNYVLKTKDFYNYQVLYNKSDLIGRELIQEWERFILRDGDVILALVGVGSIGKVNVFREQPQREYIFTRATGLIRPKKDQADSEYLHYFFLSPQGSKMIEKGIGGSTGQLVIKTSYLKDLNVLAPSLEKQKQIVQLIESKFSVIDKIEKVVEKSLEKAERLRKSILKSAFEGKLIRI